VPGSSFPVRESEAAFLNRFRRRTSLRVPAGERASSVSRRGGEVLQTLNTSFPAFPFFRRRPVDPSRQVEMQPSSLSQGGANPLGSSQALSIVAASTKKSLYPPQSPEQSFVPSRPSPSRPPRASTADRGHVVAPWKKSRNRTGYAGGGVAPIRRFALVHKSVLDGEP